MWQRRFCKVLGNLVTTDYIMLTSHGYKPYRSLQTTHSSSPWPCVILHIWYETDGAWTDEREPSKTHDEECIVRGWCSRWVSTYSVCCVQVICSVRWWWDCRNRYVLWGRGIFTSIYLVMWQLLTPNALDSSNPFVCTLQDESSKVRSCRRHCRSHIFKPSERRA